MSALVEKTYNPASLEAEIYRIWLEEKCFAADPAAAGEPYSIVIPPPNVTGALHLGHAINNTLQDILTRVHRMRGFNTVWIPGIDHAGIATQAVVEKQLKEKENKTRHDVGREGLVQRIWQWKEQYGNRIVEQLKRMGCSCDWDRTRFTLDEQCARAVRETFFKLFRDGLIYRGKRLVNWDVHLQTSISDDEIYHETVKTFLWHIRYPIQGTDKSMTVATTRPETMLGDTAVAVHSQDPRWNWAIGKSVKLPLTDRLIPIIADDILVDPKFGSGVVKVTPAHDPNDYAVWQRHQNQADAIGLINILNPDGTINEAGGAYAGMKRDAARKKVVEDLKALGLLEKEEPYETQVGHSDRSKTAIEPYLSDQWFVKMAPLAEPALQVVREGVIKFFPERHAQQYLSWLGEKRDWPISRQLWWGHRIPVWSRVLGVEATAQSGSSMASVRGLKAKDQVDDSFPLQGSDKIFARQTDSVVLADGRRATVIHICVAPGHPDLESDLIQEGFTQDPDVLDTWFSSGLWPHSTLGWPEKTPELEKWYPTSVLLTGRDIITLWVARMVMLGMYNMGGGSSSAPSPGTPGEGGGGGEGQSQTPAGTTPHPDPLPEYRARGKSLGIPFFHVAINPTILDGKGERMSKSKGNGVDPVDVIETHGADAMRFTLASMATETQDVRMPVVRDAQGRNTSEKFDLGSRFCNKIWQVANFFVIANLEKIKPQPFDAGKAAKAALADRWIVSRFARAVREADASLAAYRFDQYARTCYEFVYNDFCDWYVEAAKPALRDSAAAPRTAGVLAMMLDGSLRLLHPVIPFITEKIWSRFNEVHPREGSGGRLIRAAWPKAGEIDESAEAAFAAIQQVVTAIRALRSVHKAEPRKTIQVSIVAAGEAAQRLADNRAIIESLAVCTLAIVAPGGAAPADAVRDSAAGLDLYARGLVDADAEQQRIARRREELAKQIVTLQGRLANESYIARAPAKLVAETRDQLAAAQAELEKLS